MAASNLGRLQVILNNTGLQIKDNPTYQFLNSLIQHLQSITPSTDSGGGGGGSTVINQISNIVQSLNAFENGDVGDTVVFGPGGSSSNIAPISQGISLTRVIINT